MKTITVSLKLTKTESKLLADLLEAGRYLNQSEVLRHGLLTLGFARRLKRDAADLLYEERKDSPPKKRNRSEVIPVGVEQSE